MDQKNVILAVVLSAVIIIGWGVLQPFLFPTPPVPPHQQQQTSTPAQPATGTTAVPGGGTAEAPPALVDRNTALEQSPRVAIDGSKLKGSISLKGGRIDDVELKDYHETVDPSSPSIVMLSPTGAANAYFAEFGWGGEGTTLPDKDTIWQADRPKLTVDKPLTLTWDNGEGVRFAREFKLDAVWFFKRNGTYSMKSYDFKRASADSSITYTQ